MRVLDDTSKKPEKERVKKKLFSYREPHRGRVSRVEPDLADGLHGRHARECDLHLAEEEGRSSVALGDVLLKFFFFLGREREKERRRSRCSVGGREERRRKVRRLRRSKRSRGRGEKNLPSQWPPPSSRPAHTGGRSRRASTSRR